MRVTQNMNFDLIRDSIHKTRGRMAELQEEATSGRQLNRPSDDPVGAATILKIRTDKVMAEQFGENVQLAEAYLNNSDHALADLAEIVSRAKEIALSQSSGASATRETRVGVAEEVAQLFKRAVGSANTRIGDRYLFSGFKTDRPAVNEEGRYQGDEGNMLAEISRDVFIPMNLPGLQAFNTAVESSADKRRLMEDDENNKTEEVTGRTLASYSPDNEGLAEDGGPNAAQRDNVNIFNELQALRTSLITGDLQATRATLERFDALHSNLVAMRSKVGSRVAGLNAAMNTMERQVITNAQLATEIEDADMVATMSNIAQEETVLRNVLSSSEKLVQPTLMDFIR